MGGEVRIDDHDMDSTTDSASPAEPRPDAPPHGVGTSPTGDGKAVPLRVGRRSMLGKLAAGAAGAWAAPVILSSPAGAQPSCFMVAFQWITVEAQVNNLPTSPFNELFGSTNTIDVEYNETGLGAGVGMAGFALNPPLGNLSSFIEMQLQATGPGQAIGLTFAWDEPIRDLIFNLLDVDLGAGNSWQDEVTVLAERNGFPVDLKPSYYSFDPNFVEFDEPLSAFRGIAEAGNNTADANVKIIFREKIDYLEIIFSSGPAVLEPEPQQIGISNFFFCD
jgi:hypothetical protein